MLKSYQEIIFVLIFFSLAVFLKSPSYTIFHRHSAPVAWCEPKYQQCDFIAEFVNTMSAVFFALAPWLMIYLSQSYARLVNPHITMVWLLCSLNGFMSAYFHSTLSLIAQLLDEVSIIWCMLAGAAQLWPRQFTPKVFLEHGDLLKWSICITNVVFTVLSVVHPVLNAPLLMLSSSLFVGLVIAIMRQYGVRGERRAYRLTVRSLIMFTLAVTLWLSDQLMCQFWIHFNFPYLHGLWHISSFIAVYSGIVAVAYYKVLVEQPGLKPKLCFWPTDRLGMAGICYIHLAGVTDYRAPRVTANTYVHTHAAAAHEPPSLNGCSTHYADCTQLASVAVAGCDPSGAAPASAPASAPALGRSPHRNGYSSGVVVQRGAFSHSALL